MTIEVSCLCGCTAPNGCRVAALEAENERLVAALEDYGEHGSSCDYTGEARKWVCVCGLDAALAKAQDGQT